MDGVQIQTINENRMVVPYTMAFKNRLPQSYLFSVGAVFQNLLATFSFFPIQQLNSEIMDRMVLLERDGINLDVLWNSIPNAFRYQYFDNLFILNDVICATKTNLATLSSEILRFTAELNDAAYKHTALHTYDLNDDAEIELHDAKALVYHLPRVEGKRIDGALRLLRVPQLKSYKFKTMRNYSVLKNLRDMSYSEEHITLDRQNSYDMLFDSVLYRLNRENTVSEGLDIIEYVFGEIPSRLVKICDPIMDLERINDTHLGFINILGGIDTFDRKTFRNMCRMQNVYFSERRVYQAINKFMYKLLDRTKYQFRTMNNKVIATRVNDHMSRMSNAMIFINRKITKSGFKPIPWVFVDCIIKNAIEFTYQLASDKDETHVIKQYLDTTTIGGFLEFQKKTTNTYLLRAVVQTFKWFKNAKSTDRRIKFYEKTPESGYVSKLPIVFDTKLRQVSIVSKIDFIMSNRELSEIKLILKGLEVGSKNLLDVQSLDDLKELIRDEYDISIDVSLLHNFDKMKQQIEVMVESLIESDIIKDSKVVDGSIEEREFDNCTRSIVLWDEDNWSDRTQHDSDEDLLRFKNLIEHTMKDTRLLEEIINALKFPRDSKVVDEVIRILKDEKLFNQLLCMSITNKGQRDSIFTEAVVTSGVKSIESILQKTIERYMRNYIKQARRDKPLQKAQGSKGDPSGVVINGYRDGKNGALVQLEVEHELYDLGNLSLRVVEKRVHEIVISLTHHLDKTTIQLVLPISLLGVTPSEMDEIYLMLGILSSYSYKDTVDPDANSDDGSLRLIEGGGLFEYQIDITYSESLEALKQTYVNVLEKLLPMFRKYLKNSDMIGNLFEYIRGVNNGELLDTLESLLKENKMSPMLMECLKVVSLDKVLVGMIIDGSVKEFDKELLIDIFKILSPEKIKEFIQFSKTEVDKIKHIYLMYGVVLDEMYRRWYWLPSDGPFDDPLLPGKDWDYSNKPINGFSEHPFPGSDKGTKPVPVDLDIMKNVIDFMDALAKSNTLYYAGCVPETAIKHFVVTMFDWLDKQFPMTMDKLPNLYPDDYERQTQERDNQFDYWRIFRHIRWYAESIINNISSRDKNDAKGIKYVHQVIDKMKDYYKIHHSDDALVLDKVKAQRRYSIKSNLIHKKEAY